MLNIQGIPTEMGMWPLQAFHLITERFNDSSKRIITEVSHKTHAIFLDLYSSVFLFLYCYSELRLLLLLKSSCLESLLHVVTNFCQFGHYWDPCSLCASAQLPAIGPAFSFGDEIAGERVTGLTIAAYQRYLLHSWNQGYLFVDSWSGLWTQRALIKFTLFCVSELSEDSKNWTKSNILIIFKTEAGGGGRKVSQEIMVQTT